MHPGLCGGCRWHRALGNRRGSVFHLCRYAEIDRAYPRYPRLPVHRCGAFEAAGEEGGQERPPDGGGGSPGDGTS